MGCGASSPEKLLAAAVERGDTAATRAALDAGANANHRSKFAWRSGGLGYSPTSGITYGGPERKGYEETPVLHVAAARGDLACCTLLLDSNADPNATEGNPNITADEGSRGNCCALLLAAHAGAADCIKVLLDRGASAEWRPGSGSTVAEGAGVWQAEPTLVMAACGSGTAAGLRLLLEAGARADLTDRGYTALHYCACGGREPSIEEVDVLLAPHKPRPGADFAECARAVIEVGKLPRDQLDARDRREAAAPALAYAAHWGEAAVARVLLEFGASKDIRGPDGLTPARYAHNAGHAALALELEP
jgi:ankyrin repeat protein